MAELAGVFPAIITPFAADGDFDERVFREVVESNIQAGVHGFWVGGVTGESVLLDDEENSRIAAAASDQAAGRITNVMHIGAPTTRRAAQMAERAAAAEVDAICCVPPFFYEADHQAIVEHYRVVGAAADLPLLLYNLPQSTGVDIGPDLAHEIRDSVPQAAGLKHSGPTFEHIRDFSDLGFACFIGNSYLMLPGLTIGAVGCIDGPLCVVPELWVEIWNAYLAGDLARAAEAQRRATEVAEGIFEFGFLGALKAAISERLRVDCGALRLPQLPLSAEQRAALAERMRSLGVLAS